MHVDCLLFFFMILMSQFNCLFCVDTVLSDTGVFSPLTVTPSPDMLALKLQQVAAKTVPTSGQSRLLSKAREQKDSRGKPVGSDGVKVSQKLISHSQIHVQIHREVLSCSVRINRKRTEWEMKGLRWQQLPREPSPPPVMCLLPQVRRS